nr:unnamed protein product [Callosobruchus analis]
MVTDYNALKATSVKKVYTTQNCQMVATVSRRGADMALKDEVGQDLTLLENLVTAREQAAKKKRQLS